MSLSVPVHGAGSRTVDLPADVFDVQVNIPLIHQVVVAQQAAARQGTAKTKTRGEVSGGGKKPYRQKGTGRARQGSTRAPQFTGGGVVHGPVPRSYEQRTPKKMKAAALRGALSDRARGGRVHVVASLVEGEAPSTKAAVVALAGVVESRNVLVVAERSDELTWKSLRNAVHVHLIAPDQLNTYDVLVSDDVVFTESALASFLARPARAATATARSSEVPAEEIAAVEAVAGADEAAVAEAEADEAEAEVAEVADAEVAEAPAAPETVAGAATQAQTAGAAAPTPTEEAADQ